MRTIVAATISTDLPIFTHAAPASLRILARIVHAKNRAFGRVLTDLRIVGRVGLVRKDIGRAVIATMAARWSNTSGRIRRSTPTAGVCLCVAVGQNCGQ